MSAEQAGAALAAKTALYYGPGLSDKPTTAAEASARLSALVADQSWGRRYANGDQLARREFSDLTRLASSTNGVKEALDGTAEPRRWKSRLAKMT
jgi:hypothetical protein